MRVLLSALIEVAILAILFVAVAFLFSAFAEFVQWAVAL